MLKIFVEGKDDKIFIKAILERINPDIDFPMNDIIITDGYTNLKKHKPEFEKAKDFGKKSIVIFDADTVSDSGGFIQRKKYLEDKKKELNIDFGLFLFPNDKDDGELENLLEKIINLKHQCILECFKNYENCLEQYKENSGNYLYNLPAKDAKIYAYMEAFKKSNSEHEKFKKGDKFYLNNEYWNLDSDYLKPLIHFIKKHIIE